MKSVMVALLIGLSAGSVEANWSSPETVVSGTWGEDTTSFGINKGDSTDIVPDYVCVTSSNFIAIADSLNFRVKVYKDSVLKKNIDYAGDEYVSSWPESLWCPKASLLVVNGTDKSLYSADGIFLKTIADPNPIIKVKNNYFVTKSLTEYRLYNYAGDLVRFSATQPLEVGDVDNNVVRFNDTTYRINTPTIADYEKDANGHLNIVSSVDNADPKSGSHFTVCKYNKYGQKLGCLELPENYVTDTGDSPLITNRIVHQPVVSNNGDAYAAILSDGSYSVYRWRWIDEAPPQYVPDAPTELKSSALPGYVRLDWNLSVQDPGCVTGYEVSRADRQDGEYRAIGTVGNGVFEFDDRSAAPGITYYYKLRTLVGTMVSPYSAAVISTQGV